MSEVQQIPFLGMQGNDLSDSYQDGACYRIVNMRNRTGNSLEPVGLKELFRTILGEEQDWPYIEKVMYMPYVSHHETYILYVKSDDPAEQKVYSVMMNRNTILSQTVLYDSRLYSHKVKGVAVFGQYVVVSTENGIYSYQNNPETTPNNWDEMAPLIAPQCFVKLYQQVTLTPPQDQTDWLTITKWYASQKKTQLESGRIRGHVNFRVAYRLFDGSIGYFSRPVYAYLGANYTGNSNFDFTDVYISSTGSEFSAHFSGGDVTFNGVKVQWMHRDNHIFNAYCAAKIIKGIVILGTRLIESSDWTSQNISDWKSRTVNTYYGPVYIRIPPKIEEIVFDQLGSWYVIKEIDVFDNYIASHKQETVIDMKYYNDITTFEQAVISQTDELVCPAKMKDVSRALHMWDISKIPILSSPLLLEYSDDYPFYFEEDLDATYRLVKHQLTLDSLNKTFLANWDYELRIFAKFRSTQDYSRVESTGQWAVFGDGYIVFNSWSGALSDIEEINVYAVSKSTNIWWTPKERILPQAVAGTPDSVIFLNPNVDNGDKAPQPNYLMVKILKLDPKNLNKWEQVDVEITNINTKFIDKNRLQVSLEENPFILPAARSYRVGVASNNIVGIGTVAEELSDGRFGDFPLMIFTTAGVHALTTGQGGILYNTVVNVNDEIAISDEAIITVKGSIVFMTRRGLLLLDGRAVTNLTEQLSLHQYLDNSVVKDEEIFLSQVNDSRIVNTKENILSALGLYSIDEITSNDCMLAYDAIEGEILLNSVRREQDGSFSSKLLAFTLATKTWHIRTERFNHVTFAHPGYFLIYAYRGTIAIFKASTEDNTSTVDCMIITQPISLEYFEAKSLLRMSLKCFIETTTTQDKRFVGSMLLYARNNKYRLVKGIQFESNEPVTPIRNLSFSNPHVIADRYIYVFMAHLSRAKSQLFGLITEYQKRMSYKIK